MSFGENVVELVRDSQSDLIAAAPWWERVPQGEFATILNGYPWKSSFFNQDAGVPLIRIRDVTTGRTDTLYNGPIEDGFWVEPGDLLVGMDGDFNCIIWSGERGLLNQRVCKITPDSQFYLKDFLARVLPGYLKLINDATHSTTVKHLSSKTLAEVPLPFPPKEEQRRIVIKINSLFAKSERAREHLDHVPRLVEKYKKTLLNLAFSGALTAQWRYANGLNHDWDVRTIGSVAHIASGQTPKGIEEALETNGDVPWFKVSSMNQAENLSGLTNSDFRLSRASARRVGLRIVPAGSIAFPKRGGAIATNKKRRLLVDGGLDLNLMVLTATGVTPDFLWWWLQKLDLSSISNGSNVPQINNGDIEPLEVSVPPGPEQREIVRIIETSFAWIERLTSEAASARKLINPLNQAILSKAFRGELVPQDPNDEPASVLLERIKAEQSGAAPVRRGRGRPRLATTI